LRSIDLRQRAVKLGLPPSSKGKFAALLGKALGNREAYAACAARTPTRLYLSNQGP
jgi:hypothetical protein